MYNVDTWFIFLTFYINKISFNLYYLEYILHSTFIGNQMKQAYIRILKNSRDILGKC